MVQSAQPLDAQIDIQAYLNRITHQDEKNAALESENQRARALADQLNRKLVFMTKQFKKLERCVKEFESSSTAEEAEQEGLGKGLSFFALSALSLSPYGATFLARPG